MPKFLSIFIGMIAIYETTRAAPNPQRYPVLDENLEGLFEIPFELSASRNTGSESAFSERDKRFFDSIFPQFDFFSRRQSSFSSYSGYTNKGYNKNKRGGGFDDILRNPQDFWLNILSNNRRPAAAAVFLPVFVQPIDCGCSGTNESPDDSNNGSTNTYDGGDVTPVGNSTITLPNRFNDEVDDDEDGQRPISFKPNKPKRPLTQQPPPFEHGSVQAGVESSSNSNGFPDLSASSLPELPESTPAAMPSICDGAVIACCLQLNIGNCFERQGCADTSIYGDPCDPPVVSKVLEKFQKYYKERGIQKSFYQ